jgi:hypothetical protein
MQARSTIASLTVLIELSTENGGIVLGNTTGTITLFLTPQQTAAINWTTGVYDLEINFNSNDTRKLLAGNITVIPEVTR